MKENLRSALAIAGLLSIMTFQPATAQDVTTYSELTAAIQSAAGDSTINLVNNITGAVGDNALGTLGRTPVTIDGGGFELNGNGFDGLTVGDGQSLTLTNFADISGFLNSNDLSAGSAAFNMGNLVVNGGKISNNSAANIAGAIYNYGYLEINGTEFNQNESGGEGGAIYNWAEAVISDASFKGNTAGSYGGAIYNDDTLTVAKTSFEGNSTTESGGAIFNNYELTLNDNVTFTGNTASKSGGALYNEEDAILDIKDYNIFSNNQAGVAGGAIYNAGELTIGNSAEFKSNSAIQGGAIFHNGNTELTLNKATFKTNSATGNETASAGGAIAIGKSATMDVKIINSEFEENSSDIAGGAIFQVDGSQATIIVESTKFIKNTTGAEGGAIVSDSILNVINSTFTGNNTTSTTVGSSYLDTAEGGGAIFLYDHGVAAIENSTFEGNSSGTFGGAIGTRSGEGANSSLTITDSEFNSNTAGVKGGAISTYVETVITGTNFTSNNAVQQGGAIWTNKNTTINSVADGVTFSGNSAAQGGAIFNTALLTLNSTDGNINFSGNSAANGGASVYLDGESSELVINGTAGTVSFNDNSAIAGNGNITKDGAGTLEFVGNNDVSAFAGKYTQKNGILNLSNSTMFNNYNIKLGEFNLANSSTAIADGVNGVIEDVAGVKVGLSDGASLDVTGGTIGQNNKIVLGSGGILNVSGSGEVYFKGESVWEGSLNNAADGSVFLDGYTHNTSVGNYAQTGGTLTLQNSSELTIGNSDSSITGGNVSVESGSILNVGGGGELSGSQILVSGDLNVNIGGEISGAANTVIQSGGTVTVDGGVISSTGATEIQTNANLIIQNRGEVTLSEGSIWNGTVTNDNSTLTLNNVIHDTVNGAYEQTNGNLYLENKTKFTLSSGSTITDGTVNVSDSSFVIGDNGKVEGGLISVGSGSIFEILEGGTMSGGQVDFNGDNVTVKVNGDVLAEAIFDVTKNSVVIESPGNVTLNNDSVTGDMWTGGTIVLNGGALDFEGTRNGKNGTLLGNSGDLEVAGDSQSLVIAQGSYIKDTVNTTINSDSAIDITGGSVALGDNSQWNGTVNLASGSLDYSAQANGTLHADAGKLTTTAGSVLSINSGDYIKDAVNANIQGQLNISGTDADNGGYVTLGSGDSLLGDTNIENYGVLNLGDEVKMADSGQTITFNGSEAVMNLETNEHLDLKAALIGTDGQINKNGAGDVQFSGGTSRYQGNLLVNNSGDLTFVDEDGFGGNLEFGNVDGKEIGIIADKIHGAINQTQNAEITYSPYRDIDLNFNDKVSVSQGKLIAQTNAGRDVYFNSDTEITNGAVLATNTQNSLFSNIALTDSTLQIMQNGFTAENLSLDGNSNVQLMNGVITDNNVGNITLEDSGVGNFTVDISPRDWTSDKVLAGAISANGAGGTLNISDFQFLNKAPIDRNIPLQIFDSSKPGYENIVFSATDKEIFTPIGYYGLFPNAAGNGSYTASLTRYNPQVYRGQVATMSTWQNQLTINNLLFDHVQEINMQYLTQSNPNKYAALYPQFAPYQYNKKDGSLWFKPFGVIEKLNMTQGLNVNNTFYGALIGADFPAIELKRGWTLLPTAYIGYTGAHQSFNGVGMYQNGGQAGAMATFMKNDFIGSILAFGGGYSNKMDVAGYTDDTGNWIAGTAAKAAYNFHPSKHFVIQPTVMASYTYLGQQNWHTNFGDMSMRAEMLNGVNVAPGVNFIYGRETWSVYATVQYFYNVLGYTGGRAGNDVDLPHLRMRHGFVQYGIGATKTWKDRFSGFLQVVIRNGGRTGIGFMGGITFKF